MNNKTLWQIAAILVLALIAWLLLPYVHTPQPVANVTDFASCEEALGTIVDGEPVKCVYNGQIFAEAEHNQPDVMLELPQYGDLVTSPMMIKGQARGTWFFEANMPAVLKDENGKVLIQQGLHADTDWMTEDYVQFSGILTFDPGEAQYGVLIISKDNPSGDPERDSSYAVPVRFK